MTAALGPNMWAEIFRGGGPIGRVVYITRFWVRHECRPCEDCPPGTNAPACELAGHPPPPGVDAWCSCSLRPLGGGAKSLLNREDLAPELPREPEPV